MVRRGRLWLAGMVRDRWGSERTGEAGLVMAVKDGSGVTWLDLVRSGKPVGESIGGFG